MGITSGVELGGEMFTVSFLRGGEFEGVVMMRRRSLWVVLCWDFVIFFLAGAEFATIRKTQVVWCFCVVVISFRSRSTWRR